MLKRIAILAIIPIALVLATDISVTDAYTVPSPAVLDQPNNVRAVVSRDEVGIMDIPIHGRIEMLAGIDTLLIEDFEDPVFPPEGWDQEITNNDSTNGNPCTWFRGDIEPGRHLDNAGAYVCFNDEPSNEWLITPLIDLSEPPILSAATEGSEVKLVFNSSFTLTDDESIHHYVCVSLDGGKTWSDTLADINHDAETTEPEIVFIDEEPNPIVLDLSDYIGDSIVVGFNYYTTGEGESSIQTLDNVKVFVYNYDALWEADEVFSITSPSPQITYNYTFLSKWTPDEEGIYRLRVWTTYQGDRNPSNDEFIGRALAGGVTDLALAQILRPYGVETPNEAIIPQCRVLNNSGNECTGIVRCQINTDGGPSYFDSTIMLLDTGITTVSFKAFAVGEVGTEYVALFRVTNPLDADSSDNSQTRSFVAGYVHFIAPVEAIEPIEGQHYEDYFYPTAVFENMGYSMENNWWAKVMIVEPTSGNIWRDSIPMTSTMQPGDQATVTFKQFTPSQDEDLDYVCTFSAASSTEGFESQDMSIDFSGGPGTSVEETLPREYALGVLNSIANVVTINYAMPKSGHLSLKAYDVSGKLVANLADEAVSAGYGKLTIETQKLPTGLYFVRMETNDFSATRKLILVR